MDPQLNWELKVRAQVLLTLHGAQHRVQYVMCLYVGGAEGAHSKRRGQIEVCALSELPAMCPHTT